MYEVGIIIIIPNHMVGGRKTEIICKKVFKTAPSKELNKWDQPV